MATFRSASALANYQRKRAEAVARTIGKITKEEARSIVQRLEIRAAQLTSGGLPTSVLRDMGYPYARKRRRLTTRQRSARRLLGRVRLLPINVQTNTLRSSIQIYPRFWTSGNGMRIAFWLKSDVPYASFQLDPKDRGTKHMKPRGFWKALNEHLKKYELKEIRKAQLRAKRLSEKIARLA